MSGINVKLKIEHDFIPKKDYETYRGDNVPAVASFGGNHLIDGKLIWDDSCEEYQFYTPLAHAPLYIGHWERELVQHKLWVIKITPIVQGF